MPRKINLGMSIKFAVLTSYYSMYSAGHRRITCWVHSLRSSRLSMVVERYSRYTCIVATPMRSSREYWSNITTGAAIGICTTCETTQKLTTPRFSARLFIHSQNRNKATPLKAHGDILRSIAQKESITLYAPAFNCRYNKFKVVTEVTRD